MYDYEVTTTVATSPDRLFAFLADVRHLPDYFPKVLAAKGGEGEAVSVTLEVGGQVHDVAAWVRADPGTRRLQWGVPDSGYQGWLSVSPSPYGCELIVNLQTPAPGEPGATSVDPNYELVDTVESIRQIMRRAGAASRPA